MSDAELTRALALYGAAVSTIAILVSLGGLAWTIYRDIRDTGRLKVSLMFGRIKTTGPVPALREVMTPKGMVVVNLSERSRLFITATNTGRRPITVAKVWGFTGARIGVDPVGWRRRVAFHREGFVLATLNLPKMLEPGAELTEWLDDSRMMRDIRESPQVSES